MDTNELPDRDPLTGLLARGASLRLITERARPAAVVLVDLDDVSALNDRFGYKPVDEALVEIAARLDRLSAGAAARLGGDEFLLVVAAPVGDIGSEAVATRVRGVISDEPVRVRSGVRIHVTATVVAAPLATGADPMTLVRDLDNRLCEAKREPPPSSAA